MSKIQKEFITAIELERDGAIGSYLKVGKELTPSPAVAEAIWKTNMGFNWGILTFYARDPQGRVREVAAYRITKRARRIIRDGPSRYTPVTG